MIDRDKIAGALYGVALGDAMGRDTEFIYTLKEIWKRYGKYGHMQLPHPAKFTDDTQMTLAVARALKTARGLTPQELSRTTRTEFIRWARVDERRAPGRTCMMAVAKLERGLRWQDATIIKSKGCGANMRVAPAAFIADYDTAVGYSQLQAALTHGHPTGIAAAELTALAMRWAAQEVPLRELPNMLLRHAASRVESYETEWLGKLRTRQWYRHKLDMRLGWVENAQALRKVKNALNSGTTPADPCDVGGEGWIAEEALATALYCAVRYGYDAVEAISMAARTKGDSDSIASITGGILGAAYGETVWPSQWRSRIERHHEIEEAINTVHSLS
jgi:ADP-ribosylglycohydrolase